MFDDIYIHIIKYGNHIVPADDPVSRLFSYLCLATNKMWTISVDNFNYSATSRIRECFKSGIREIEAVNDAEKIGAST